MARKIIRNRRKDSKKFARTAARTNVVNKPGAIVSRGGIRL